MMTNVTTRAGLTIWFGSTYL